MDVLFPSTIAELHAMQSREPAGRILAGGTDLLVALRKTESSPPVLFSLEHLTELQQIEVSQTEIHIGAAVTQQGMLDCPAVREKLPGLHQAVKSMASPPVRHAATLGGNIWGASPAGDTLPPLYVLNAEVVLDGPAGQRRRKIADFIEGPGRNAAKTGEVLIKVVIPLPPADAFSVYHKVGKRRSMAIAVASLAMLATISPERDVQSIKLAWGSVGPRVMMLPEVEAYLTGRPLTIEALRGAGRLASAGVAPIDDVRAKAEYRRQLAGNLLVRLLGTDQNNWR